MMVLFTCNYKISYKQGSNKESIRHTHTTSQDNDILHRKKSNEVMKDNEGDGDIYI